MSKYRTKLRAAFHAARNAQHELDKALELRDWERVLAVADRLRYIAGLHIGLGELSAGAIAFEKFRARSTERQTHD